MSWLAVVLGLSLGLRHALDPDHVAAVTTLLAGGPKRESLRRGLRVGAWWGLGHAAALALSVTVLSLLSLELRPALPVALELAVSVMLVVLGARALWRSWRDGNRGAAAPHRHGRTAHTHPMSSPHVHIAGTGLAWRPFLVGSLHGLAGSGGMMLLISTQQRTGWSIAGFTLAFVLGSILSMAAVTAAGSLALGALHARAQRWMMAIAGAASVVIGIGWAVPQLAALT